MKQRVTIRPRGEVRVLHGGRPVIKYNIDDSYTLVSSVTYEGDFEVEAEDLDSYVQVKYLDRGALARRYTYRDPSGTLKVGDLVEAPVGYDGLQLAKVVELGRGKYSGPIKDIKIRIVREEL